MGILEKYTEQIGKLVTFLGIKYVQDDGLTADQIVMRHAYAQKYAIKQLWLVIKAIVAQRSMVIGILANISGLQWGLQAGIICTLVGFLFLAL